MSEQTASPDSLAKWFATFAYTSAGEEVPERISRCLYYFKIVGGIFEVLDRIGSLCVAMFCWAVGNVIVGLFFLTYLPFKTAFDIQDGKRFLMVRIPGTSLPAGWACLIAWGIIAATLDPVLGTVVLGGTLIAASMVTIRSLYPGAVRWLVCVKNKLCPATVVLRS